MAKCYFGTEELMLGEHECGDVVERLRKFWSITVTEGRK
jgi:hypothetical protein